MIASYNDDWPTTLGGLNMDLSRRLRGGIDFVGTASTPDKLRIYEVSDLATPMLIGQFNFPTNQQANRQLYRPDCLWGNKIYALNGNNGIVVVTLQGPAPTLNVTLMGGQAVISWSSSFGSGFTLYSTTSLTPTITWSPEGAGTLIGGSYWVTNDLSAAAKFYRLQ